MNFYLKKFNYSYYSVPSFVTILILPNILLKRIGPVLVELIDFDNVYYQFSILMDNLQLFIILFQTAFILNNLNKIETLFFNKFRVFRIFRSKKISKSNSNFIFTLTLISYLFFFLLLTNTNTNTVTWILNPRDGYQFYREGAGLWYSLAIIFLGINSVILFIYRIKKIKTFIFYSLLYCYLWYLFGGKAYILAYFTLLLLATTINFEPKFSKRFFKLGIFGAFILILLLFFNSGISGTISESFDSIFTYFDHYNYSTLFYQDIFVSKFDLFYGKIFLTNFYKYIPRAIFLEKPFAYGPVLLNEIYLPGLAELGHTPEFGGQASYFADFGVLGVVFFNLIDLNFLFKTFFYTLVLKYANQKHKIYSSLYFAPLVFSFSPAFSQFISFPFDILMLIFLLTLFSLFYKKSYENALR